MAIKQRRGRGFGPSDGWYRKSIFDAHERVFFTEFVEFVEAYSHSVPVDKWAKHCGAWGELSVYEGTGPSPFSVSFESIMRPDPNAAESNSYFRSFNAKSLNRTAERITLETADQVFEFRILDKVEAFRVRCKKEMEKKKRHGR